MNNAGIKVIVGMSGGVDSSMAAALLKEQGYDVIGVTLQIWPSGEQEGGCCSISAIDDARRVAYQLGIPHYVWNFRSFFEEKVVDYFTGAYLQGRTPNPCLLCNKVVRWGEFLRKARSIGADYIATGHYAQVVRDDDSGRFLLLKGADEWKDQSYMLYTLTQDQLAHTLFPLAEYRKERIREMARERGIATAYKPDSQEICFIPNNDYASFISERNPEARRPGNFVDRKGNVLGQHQGIAYYTIGQRKGLGIAFGKPMYVIGIDPERNEVILGEDPEVYHDTLWACDLNWISIPELKEPMRVEAKIRYKANPAWATVSPVISKDGQVIPDRVKVTFDEPQRAITPGQAVVFYQGKVVVGGGIIISDPRGSVKTFTR